MSQQVAVGTLFVHGVGDDYLVAVSNDGERSLSARLTLGATDAGPRPAKFARRHESGEEPLRPDRFVELARRADRIRISQQTGRSQRERIERMLDGYQLDAKTVRTCRYCASAGRYSPVTSETAIEADGEQICPDCARRELDAELAHHDVSSTAADRLQELLLDVQDLERVKNLLSGQLDPDLTKFDEMSATTEAVDPVPVGSLGLHPGMQSLLDDRFESLLPVQSLAVQNGALDGDDQLVVSATATGKTLIGEMAGLDRLLNGEGKMLFLVPLVALANQKYEDFRDEYGHLANVTIRVGASRVRDDGERFDPDADIVVGTYEGIDHALRVGQDLGDIGTVVIDEVHTLEDDDRGHRLDGLIARLKGYCENRNGNAGGNGTNAGTQWLYLSATVGNPGWLATKLRANLVEFEERPVPIERHVTFADGQEKARVANKLVRREFDRKSSQGYRGQTIIFTNSRRRCHQLARKLEYDAAAYHAGLDYSRRKSVERQFANQDLAAVVTTAALAAGVDFPASQVLFDSLAMGIEWLTVQEFHQMLGRAGRPDYHDRGVVYVLVEPDGSYHSSMPGSEDETAFRLLKGEMEPVAMRYDETSAVEEVLANVTVAGGGAKALTERMVGDVPMKHAVGKLLDYDFIDGLSPTPLGRAVTRHFLEPEAAFTMLDGIRKGKDPYDTVAEIELRDEES
ncbi:DEAD/DEAH box helicase domain-containing protein [Halococcus morrhuae DSM 1307]|uniref:DEAD/DEAH box helicase domain-containing protein n=1 Tax=Halococcus morrhuae DSM 1307 TaxID=931277 RepID=M0MDX0_HALMO|nr:DEAD/DEAH box helicase [Halococcus morrhuae]EMA43952.1 DEAD/DEAH box helicase domain-containing protein [Halococcus morrhuae DSM 1307]